MAKLFKEISKGYHLAKLEACDWKAIIALQQRVIRALPKDEKYFLAKKTADQIKQNLAPPHYAVGVFGRGFFGQKKLVGAAFLLAASPKTLLDDLDQSQLPHFTSNSFQGAAIITTVMSDPKVKGQKLMRHMLKHLESIAHQKSVTSLWARVVRENTKCQKKFEDVGFDVAGVAKKLCTRNNATRVILSKPLYPAKQVAERGEIALAAA